MSVLKRKISEFQNEKTEFEFWEFLRTRSLGAICLLISVSCSILAFAALQSGSGLQLSMAFTHACVIGSMDVLWMNVFFGIIALFRDKNRGTAAAALLLSLTALGALSGPVYGI